MPANELPPSPEKLLFDIGILQNEAQARKDHIQAQNEIINQLKNTLKAYQKSIDTYLHPNLGGNTTDSPQYTLNMGVNLGVNLKKIYLNMRVNMGVNLNQIYKHIHLNL